MFEKIKGFFETKYRVVPVYSDNNKCKFVVQSKSGLLGWRTISVQKLEKVKTETEVLIDKDALFNTEEEAKDFIRCKKTIL